MGASIVFLFSPFNKMCVHAGAGPHLLHNPLPRVSTSPLFTLQLLKDGLPDGLNAPCVERFTG